MTPTCQWPRHSPQVVPGPAEHFASFADLLPPRPRGHHRTGVWAGPRNFVRMRRLRCLPNWDARLYDGHPLAMPFWRRELIHLTASIDVVLDNNRCTGPRPGPRMAGKQVAAWLNITASVGLENPQILRRPYPAYTQHVNQEPQQKKPQRQISNRAAARCSDSRPQTEDLKPPTNWAVTLRGKLQLARLCCGSWRSCEVPAAVMTTPGLSCDAKEPLRQSQSSLKSPAGRMPKRRLDSPSDP